MPRNATAVPIIEVRLSLTRTRLPCSVGGLSPIRFGLVRRRICGRVIPRIPVFAGRVHQSPPSGWVSIIQFPPITVHNSTWGCKRSLGIKFCCNSTILLSPYLGIYYCTKTVTYFTLISLPGHPKHGTGSGDVGKQNRITLVPICGWFLLVMHFLL